MLRLCRVLIGLILLACGVDVACGAEPQRTAPDASRAFHVAPVPNLPEHAGLVSDVAFSADGRLMATIGQDLIVKICSAESGRVLREWSVGKADSERPIYYAASVAFAPQGSLLAVGTPDSVQLYDAATGGLQHRLTQPDLEQFRTVRFTATGDRLVAAGERKLAMWKLPGGEFSHSFELPSAPTKKFALTPDGRFVACATNDKSVDLLDLSTGELAHRFTGAQKDNVLALAINAAGTLLVASDAAERLVVYDLQTRTERLRKDGERYSALAFGPDGILAAGFDGVDFFLVDDKRLLPIGQRLRRLNGDVATAHLVFSPDGRRFAAERGYQNRAALFALAWSQAERTVFTVPEHCRALQASHDGRLLAWAHHDTLKLFSAADGKEIASTKLDPDPDKQLPIDFSFDDTKLLIRLGLNSDKTVQVFDVATLKRERSWELRDHWDARFTPDGREVLLFPYYSAVRQPLAAEQPVKGERDKGELVPTNLIRARFTPDGTRIIGQLYDQIGVFDWTTQKKLQHFPTGHYIEEFSASPDGKFVAEFAVKAGQKRVRVWDLAKQELAAEIEATAAGLQAVAFTGDGRALLTVANDGWLKAWSCADWKLLAAAPLYPADARSNVYLTVVPKSSVFYACTGVADSREATVRQWDLTKWLERSPPPADPTDVVEPPFTAGIPMFKHAAHSPGDSPGGYHDGGKSIYFCHYRDELVSLDPVTKQEHWRLKMEEEPRWIEFSRDDRRFAVAFAADRFSDDKNKPQRATVKVYEAATRRLLHTLTLETMLLECVAFSPDGRTLAAASGDLGARDEQHGELSLWDVETGRRTSRLPLKAGRFTRVRFSPDGALLACCDFDEQVYVWDLKAQQLRYQRQIKPMINDVQFSPDGKWLAVGCGSFSRGRLALLDAATGAPQPGFESFDEPVSSLGFSPRGDLLVAACAIDADAWGVSIWSLPEMKELRRVRTEESIVGAGIVSFTPDGKRFLATGDEDLQIWDVDDLLNVPLQRALEQLQQSAHVVYEGDLLAVHGPPAVERELARFPNIPRPFMVYLAGEDQLTDAGLALLAKQPQLVGLDVSRCEKLTLAGLAAIRGLPLRKLRVYASYSPDEVKQLCSILKDLVTLEELTTTSSSYDDDASVLDGLEKLVRLRSLKFEGASLNAAALRTIAGLPQLEELVLEHYLGDDDSLRPLATLGKLKSLQIKAGDKFTGRGLGFLQGCKELTVLDLQACRGLTADGLKSLRHFPQLQTLDLRYTNLADAATPMLPQLPELQRLYLPHDLTDAAVPNLLGLKKLRFLSLYGDRFSEPAKEQLRKAFRDGEVRIDGL